MKTPILASNPLPSTTSESGPSLVPKTQPLVFRQADDWRASSLRSSATGRADKGPGPEAAVGQCPLKQRQRRALQEPQQGINESFQDYQNRHYAWRGGAGPIPEDEGRLPPKTLVEKIWEVFLSVVTAPGIGPADVLPEVPGSGVVKVAPERPSAGSAEVKPQVDGIKENDTGPGSSSAAGGVKPGPSGAGEVNTPNPNVPTFAQIDNEPPYTLPGSGSGSGASDVESIDWNIYMREDASASKITADIAEKRQKQLYEQAGIDPAEVLGSSHRIEEASDPTGMIDYDLVALYGHDSNEYFNNAFRLDGGLGLLESPQFIGELADVLEILPETQGVTLYRGGSGTRGTSGENFRSGEIKVGDNLINADFTSFTENPYVVKDFATGNVGKKPGGYVYDNTSVVFILENAQDARAIAPLTGIPGEVESMYTPGHIFTVKGIETSTFDGRPLVQVRIGEGKAESTSGKTFDFRTGKPFDRQVMVDRIGPEYADRFFPRASGSGGAAH